MLGLPVLAICGLIAAVVSLRRRRLQLAFGFGLIGVVATFYSLAVYFGGAAST